MAHIKSAIHRNRKDAVRQVRKHFILSRSQCIGYLSSRLTLHECRRQLYFGSRHVCAFSFQEIGQHCQYGLTHALDTRGLIFRSRRERGLKVCQKDGLW